MRFFERRLAAVLLLSVSNGFQDVHAQPSSDAAGPLAEEVERPAIARLYCPAIVGTPQRIGDDHVAPGDYDGDGRADASIVRPNGMWMIDYARDIGLGAYEEIHEWPAENGVFARALPGYYDRDCKADRGAVDASGNWYIDHAADGFGTWVKFAVVAAQCPTGGNRRHCLAAFTYVPADYDGDGLTDLAVKTKSGVWRIDYANNGYSQTAFDANFPGYGGVEFVPVPADYDGDGAADFSTRDGDNWYVDWSSNGRGEANWDAIFPGFGRVESFLPTPADYDGDGQADFSSRDADNWYIDGSRNGRGGENWDAIYPGFSRIDQYSPAPADYDGAGDGERRADLASHTAAGDWLIDFAADGFGEWDQMWNSFAAVSGGAATADDLLEFDVRWMTDHVAYWAKARACGWAMDRFGAGVWETTERMEAMARMFLLTRDDKYIKELLHTSECLLAARDDNHPVPAKDVVRDKERLAAWGGAGLNSANKHHVAEVVSSLYAYSIALFARIVLEDPSLHGAYGQRATALADNAFETVLVFRPQFKTRADGAHNLGFLVMHPNLNGAWTDQECTDAFENAKRAWRDEEGAEPPGDTVRWWDQQQRNCKHANDEAGTPMSYNENAAFAMLLIELTRAFDSPFYRQTSSNPLGVRLSQRGFPTMVAQVQRHFYRALKCVVDRGSYYASGDCGADPENPRYVWKHAENSENCCEDDSHGGLSMRYIHLLNANLERLSARSSEPILLEPRDLQLFANTFLHMTEHGNVADRIDGNNPDDNPDKENNSVCVDWVGFASIEAGIYGKCHEMVLRKESGLQPSLTAGSHAALIANGVRR